MRFAAGSRSLAACGLLLVVCGRPLSIDTWLRTADRKCLCASDLVLSAPACSGMLWSGRVSEQSAFGPSGKLGERMIAPKVHRGCIDFEKKISAARHRSAARVRAPRELYVQSTLKKISAARHQSAARARAPRDGPSDKLAERMSMFKKHGKYTYFVISVAARQLWVSAQVPRGLALRPSFVYVKFLYLKEIS